MLRPFTSPDLPSVQDLVVAAGMFTSGEVGFLAEQLTATEHQLPHDSTSHAACQVSTTEGGINGVVYYRPEDAADGVWDLTMIAVHPDHQRGGIGSELVQHVERTLSVGGARLLAVRTSSTTRYDEARAFYEHAGYVRAATVQDWWAEGDDLILFTKRVGNTARAR